LLHCTVTGVIDVPRRKHTEAMEGLLIPPVGGATVRMYRTGHGDCFLLAFAGHSIEQPVYVLIDCGFKFGSPQKIKPPTDINRIITDLLVSTGGRLDVAVITHEHQDHVNGITAAAFREFSIGQLWFAWTEDPSDPLAIELRRKHKDTLLGLLHAQKRTSSLQIHSALVSNLLELTDGENDLALNPTSQPGLVLAASPTNKESMKVWRDKADEIRYLLPHESTPLPKAKDVRVFVLGPPYDAKKISDEDPIGSEAFVRRMIASVASNPGASDPNSIDVPFDPRFSVPWSNPDNIEFFLKRYDSKSTNPVHDNQSNSDQIPDNALFRRIDHDWLGVSDELALSLSSGVNNTSLVLAFELGRQGKVLLFVADAQRGSWRSWADSEFKVGSQTVSTRSLLERTVLYKVGHHGSHNGTLHGEVSDSYPNLSWMGHGKYGQEFTAMITAVPAWAQNQPGWHHPFPPIKAALLKKAAGRVLQTDAGFDEVLANRPEGTDLQAWKAFVKRTQFHELYFDVRIESDKEDG
jgi:beta-lactamase superfamily II metal-dependent hydrolase